MAAPGGGSGGMRPDPFRTKQRIRQKAVKESGSAAHRCDPSAGDGAATRGHFLPQPKRVIDSGTLRSWPRQPLADDSLQIADFMETIDGVETDEDASFKKEHPAASSGGVLTG